MLSDDIGLGSDLEPVCSAARTRAEQTLAELAKPPGSLGRLEQLGARLAAAQHTSPPRADRLRALVFAADHAVARTRRVSAYPPSVTEQMLATFADGGAAVNVLSQVNDADVEVIDLGVDGGDAIPADGTPVRHERIRPGGSGDITESAAMTSDQCRRALTAGADAVDAAVADGVDVVALGEMGIGNTTPTTAVACRLTGAAPDALAGRGTGVDDAGLARKRRAVVDALDRSDAPADRPFEVLADLGGLELAALAGAAVRAAEHHCPIVVDGFIVTTAMLAATSRFDALADYLVPATRSAVRGHDIVLDALACGEPLLDWDLRLGEASAAVLVAPMLRSACALFDGMATLADVVGSKEET